MCEKNPWTGRRGAGGQAQGAVEETHRARTREEARKMILARQMVEDCVGWESVAGMARRR